MMGKFYVLIVPNIHYLDSSYKKKFRAKEIMVDLKHPGWYIYILVIGLTILWWVERMSKECEVQNSIKRKKLEYLGYVIKYSKYALLRHIIV